jgi:hypothetical protein
MEGVVKRYRRRGWRGIEREDRVIRKEGWRCKEAGF